MTRGKLSALIRDNDDDDYGVFKDLTLLILLILLATWTNIHTRAQKPEFVSAGTTNLTAQFLAPLKYLL